jgi:hypothetical protein
LLPKCSDTAYMVHSVKIGPVWFTTRSREEGSSWFMVRSGQEDEDEDPDEENPRTLEFGHMEHIFYHVGPDKRRRVVQLTATLNSIPSCACL